MRMHRYTRGTFASGFVLIGRHRYKGDLNPGLGRLRINTECEQSRIRTAVFGRPAKRMAVNLTQKIGRRIFN